MDHRESFQIIGFDTLKVLIKVLMHSKLSFRTFIQNFCFEFYLLLFFQDLF